MAIIVSILNKGGDTPHKIARLWAESILFASRVKVTVRGQGNLNPKGSYIYMCNHQSVFDIPVLLAHLRVQFRWLAKHELFQIPLFGTAMARAGYISINRTDRRSAFESLNRAARIIRNGVSVLIFPEGTRSKDGKIRLFKKGGFVMAVDSGVPIVPVTLHGTWEIMAKDKRILRSGNVVLEIHRPIETSSYSRKTKDDLMNAVREVICTAVEKHGKFGR